MRRSPIYLLLLCVLVACDRPAPPPLPEVAGTLHAETYNCILGFDPRYPGPGGFGASSLEVTRLGNELTGTLTIDEVSTAPTPSGSATYAFQATVGAWSPRHDSFTITDHRASRTHMSNPDGGAIYPERLEARDEVRSFLRRDGLLYLNLEGPSHCSADDIGRRYLTLGFWGIPE